MPEEDLVCRHPPERGTPERRCVVVYSCCCCCCCCLHTVGGFVGALLGGGLRADPEMQFDPERRIPLVHWLFGRLPWTQWIFWSSFAIVIGISLLVAPLWLTVVGTASGAGAVAQAPLYVAGAVILAGPLFLLAAGALSAIRLALTREPKVTREHWSKLGLSVLGSVGGCVAGVVVMYVVFLVMTQ